MIGFEHVNVVPIFFFFVYNQSFHLKLSCKSSPEFQKTSQELRMLSSVTINCHEFRFSIVRIVISVSNVTSPRIVQKPENLPKNQKIFQKSENLSGLMKCLNGRKSLGSLCNVKSKSTVS